MPVGDPRASAAGRPARLLLIDDYEFIRVGVRTMCADLHGRPVEWLEAGTLRDGIDLYRSHSDIDVVLLDLNLADCKGLQGLRIFMERHPEARVIIFSGTQDEFVIRQARALGAQGYIRKTGAADKAGTEVEARQLMAPDTLHVHPGVACANGVNAPE